MRWFRYRGSRTGTGCDGAETRPSRSGVDGDGGVLPGALRPIASVLLVALLALALLFRALEELLAALLLGLLLALSGLPGSLTALLALLAGGQELTCLRVTRALFG